MNVSAATPSDLAPQTRQALTRVLAIVLLCGTAVLTLPAAGLAQSRDGVDWETVKSTPPENWSQDLKDQIAAAGHDVDAVAERVRHHLADETARSELAHAERVWKAAMATDPDQWSDRLKAALLELMPDRSIEEIAEGIRQRRRAERVWKTAMATDPDQWSDRLKAAIVRAGWDLDEFTQGIRQRQAARRDKTSSEEEGKRRGSDTAPTLEDVERRIRTAVANGDLTAEEGRKKMAEARLRNFQRGVIARAMAADPNEWSDRLKAAIVRAGWDLDEFTQGVRRRQASAGDGDSSENSDFESLFQLNTAIEGASWGQLKDQLKDDTSNDQ